MRSQMMRVISSPSSSTTGFVTLILSMKFLGIGIWARYSDQAMQRQSGRIFGLLGLVLVLAALAGPAAGGRLPLAKVADYPLTGGTGRFDYQAMDADHHRLFISHMGAGSVIAFDLENRRVIATLDGFPGATGITVA